MAGSVMTIAQLIPFVANLIGCRWERGATGPERWDCGSLVIHVQRAAFGRELPLTLDGYAGLASAEAIRRAVADVQLAQDWPAHDQRRHGDVVLLQRGDFAHVGTWLELPDQRGLLHCARHQGVRFDDWLMVKGQAWTSIRSCRPAGGAS